jgi:hypothetical protein
MRTLGLIKLVAGGVVKLYAGIVKSIKLRTKKT